MSGRDSLRESIDRDGFTKEQPPKKSRHQRYFEGYQAYRVLQPGRKRGKTIRVYTDSYHRAVLSRRDRFLTKAVYCVAFLGSVAAFIVGGCTWYEGRIWLNTLVEAVSVAMLAWMGISLLNYLLVGERMTHHEFRTGPLALKRSSLIAFISLVCLVPVTALSFLLAEGQPGFAPYGKGCLFSGLAAILVFLLHRIECKIIYEETSGDSPPT